MRHTRFALMAMALGGSQALSGQQVEVPRVIVIGIDGLGSENVWRGTYNGVPAPVIPHIDRLKDRGAYTLKARIDSLNFSGPNWAGLVTGSSSSEHGVNTNECTRGDALPTIYERLRDAFRPEGYVRQHRLAVVHEWFSIACYYDPSAVDFRVNTRDEKETADWVIDLIDDESIVFTFVYFGALDNTGHRFGGNSVEYKEKIEAIDTEIGRILAAIAESSQADSTYVILTADHGHLPDGGGHSPADAPVPFIVFGPDVAVGELDSDVRNNQVAPLVAHIFGVEPNPVWSAPLVPFDSLISRAPAVAIDVWSPSAVVNVGARRVSRAYTSFSDGTSRDVSFLAVWSSSDEAVFTASAGGLGSAVGPGDADICATYLGVVGCLSLTVLADPPPQPISRTLPGDVRVHRDIAYAVYGDRTLQLDLFEPRDRGGELLPAIVAIPGGPWLVGAKEAEGPMAAALAQRGFVAVSIEYRSGEAGFPAAVHDTKAAVRWVRANAESYGIDPRAVGAIGGYAGAHLALYLGVTAGQRSLEGAGGYPTESSAVSAVVGLSTPADLTLLGDHFGTLTAFLGSGLADDRDLWERASPVTHVSEESPPALLIHNEANLIVPVQQSLNLAAAYRSNSVPVDVVLLPDAPIRFWRYAPWYDETMDRAAGFFRQHLRGTQ